MLDAILQASFKQLPSYLENQVEIQLWQFEAQVYGEIERQIKAARQKEEEAIASSNKWVGQLAEIRKDFEEIIGEVTQAMEVSVA